VNWRGNVDFFLETVEDTWCGGDSLAEQTDYFGQSSSPSFGGWLECMGGIRPGGDRRSYAGFRTTESIAGLMCLSARGDYVSAILCEQVERRAFIFGRRTLNAKRTWSIRQSGCGPQEDLATTVEAGEPLCTVHCHSDAQAAGAIKLLELSYTISDAVTGPQACV